MRETSVVITAVLLLAALLVPCPACLQGEAEGVPADAHACCQRAQQSGEPQESGDSATPDGRTDCSNYGLLQTLAELKAEATPERVADSFVRLPGVRTVVDTVHDAAGTLQAGVVKPLFDFFCRLVLPDTNILVPLRL